MVLCHLAAVHTIYKSHFGLPSSGWFRQYYVDANELYITAAVIMFMVFYFDMFTFYSMIEQHITLIRVNVSP